ncbi:hypothetical protein KEM48_005547 [Puccinia striiformis f. sp. tritici PST-130]|nr:hypothetical protein KEM48_005547 [Puccinia striiformis f. sp. tritici PST-130]
MSSQSSGKQEAILPQQEGPQFAGRDSARATESDRRKQTSDVVGDIIDDDPVLLRSISEKIEGALRAIELPDAACSRDWVLHFIDQMRHYEFRASDGRFRTLKATILSQKLSRRPVWVGDIIDDDPVLLRTISEKIEAAIKLRMPPGVEMMTSDLESYHLIPKIVALCVLIYKWNVREYLREIGLSEDVSSGSATSSMTIRYYYKPSPKRSRRSSNCRLW